MLGGNGDNNNVNKFKGFISHSLEDKNKKDNSQKDTDRLKDGFEKELKDNFIFKSTKVH